MKLLKLLRSEGTLAKIFRLTLLSLALAAGIELALEKSELILFGVEVQKISLGGCTRQKAGSLLTEAAARMAKEKVALVIEDKSYTYTKGELGLEFQLEEALRAAYAVGREGSIIKRLSRRENYAEITLGAAWNKEKLLQSIRPLENLYNALPASAELSSENLSEAESITNRQIAMSAERRMDIEGLYQALRMLPEGEGRIIVEFLRGEGS